MPQFFRRNPFTSAQRQISLPGGTGDPLFMGGTLGTQFFDYRVEGVVVPFMYVGCDIRTGEISLNFLDADRRPFLVSDAVKRHASVLGAEMAGRFIEAYPDYGIRTDVSASGPDPIPRYKNANDDPWMDFVDCDVVERVDTEIGELVVASSGVFEIRVGAGTDRGVPGLRIDGKSYTFRHDYVVRDGEVVPAEWRGQSQVHDPRVDIGKPSFEQLGFEEALGQRQVGDPAPRTVSDTVARVSATVARDFLERRFTDIRGPVVRMFRARMRALEESRAVVGVGLEFASPQIRDFHRGRIAEFTAAIDLYAELAEEILALEGPGLADSMDKVDGHYVRRDAGPRAPGMR